MNLNEISKYMAMLLRHKPEKMLKDGHKFYISDNNVVVVECVPKRYLKQISIGEKY